MRWAAIRCAHAQSLEQGGSRKLSSDSRFHLSDLLGTCPSLSTPPYPIPPQPCLSPQPQVPLPSTQLSEKKRYPQSIFSRRRRNVLKERRNLEGRFFRRIRQQPQSSAAVFTFSEATVRPVHTKHGPCSPDTLPAGIHSKPVALQRLRVTLSAAARESGCVNGVRWVSRGRLLARNTGPVNF